MERPSLSSSAARTPRMHWQVSHYVWALSDEVFDLSMSLDSDWSMSFGFDLYYCRYYSGLRALLGHYRGRHHDSLSHLAPHALG